MKTNRLLARAKSLKNKGNFEQARELYNKILDQSPQNPLAKKGLLAIDDRSGATQHVSRELELQLKSATTLVSNGQLYAAVKVLNKLALKYPDSATLFYTRGRCFQLTSKLDVAISDYNRAITLDQKYADAHAKLGVTLNVLGQSEAAIESLQRALNIDPNNVSALCSLYPLKLKQPDSIPIEVINKLYDNEKLTNRERILVCYTLAKAYNKPGEENTAFDYLLEANKLSKAEVGYKFYKSENTFSSIKKLFSVKHPILNVDNFESLSKIRPIFIVGMPRSGTSLTEQILDSHSSVRGAGELEFMNQLAHIIMQEQQANLTRQYPKPLSKNSMSAIRTRYHSSLQALNYPENIIVDKMPLNFRWVGLILSAFPEAKIIHLKRDPVATCWSNFNRYFPVHGLGFTNNLNDLAKFYHLYTDLMTFWHQRFPNKIYDLCYEDLTENQEQETKKLLAYCELEWEDACLNFHENTRRVVTASANQVGQKMYQGSSKSWKKYEHQLQPLVKALNY